EPRQAMRRTVAERGCAVRSAGCGPCPRRNCAELTIQTKEVEVHPRLGSLAALVASDDDSCDRAPPPGRGDSRQVALVRAGRADARHDLVIFGDDILDREDQVREGIAKERHFLSHAIWTAL